MNAPHQGACAPPSRGPNARLRILNNCRQQEDRNRQLKEKKRSSHMRRKERSRWSEDIGCKHLLMMLGMLEHTVGGDALFSCVNLHHPKTNKDRQIISCVTTTGGEGKFH